MFTHGLDHIPWHEILNTSGFPLSEGFYLHFHVDFNCLGRVWAPQGQEGSSVSQSAIVPVE